jgi:AraC-like DNA-binding protein
MRPRIRTATLTGFTGLARSLGLAPEALAAEVDLDPAVLETPDTWIPAAPAARLLELAAGESGCEDFGLRLAGRRRLGTLGPISVVLRDEPDLRSALDLLIRYERAYNEALHLRLTEDGGLATIATWLEFGEPAPTRQGLDLVMGALIGVIRALVGAEWEPRSASFARPEPADRQPWVRTFGGRVRFDQGVTGLVVPAGRLADPVVTSDSSLRPYTRQFLQLVVPPRALTVSAEVAGTVELLLPLGRCSLEQVSRHVGLSPRALQRALAEEGAGFSTVVGATRARLAERYLTNERYSLTDVSQLLGFGAPSAFTRWFQQRFGTSPSRWRRAARADPRVAGPGSGETVREG